MQLSFEQTLIEVWRQALVENAKVVELGKERYPVRRTPKRGLRQVDFMLDGNEIRGLEQNPETKSRWAQTGLCLQRFLSVIQKALDNSFAFMYNNNCEDWQANTTCERASKPSGGPTVHS